MFKRGAWCSLALLLCVPVATAAANVITDWDEKGVAVVQTKMPPPSSYRVDGHHASRDVEAVNSIEPHYRPTRPAAGPA